MKRFIPLLLMIVSGFSQLKAQKHLPSNFFMTQLENGLQVLVIEDNSVPLATIEIAVHNGSYTEDSAFNGLSHLYEHMFLRRIKISLHRRHISKSTGTGHLF